MKICNAYYPNGLKHTYTNPEGMTYTYYYNKNNQLTAVHIPGQGQLTWNDFQWLMPQTLLLPGGTKITLSYNDFLQVEERILKDPANNNVASALYEYDRENNINRITSEQGLYSFDYDNLYRLTHADYPLDTAANDEVFAYDGVGNRTGHTQVENTGVLPVDDENNGGEGEGDNPPPSSTSTLAYNNQNQLTQATGDTGTANYTYNANGHTATKTDNGTTTEYVYNHEERLIAVRVNGTTVGEYAYNPYGMRIKKTTYANGTATTTWYLYNDKGLAAEYDSSGNLRKEYHFHPQKTWMTDPLFQRAADNQVYYYQNDHLGTPQRLIRSNGATVWRATYTAFGEATVDPDSIENNLRFPGQYYDQETGLHHNYYRDYDPHTGRYLQADPIGLRGGANIYVYALNKPIKAIDPRGLDLVLVGEGGKSGGMFNLAANTWVNNNPGNHTVVNVSSGQQAIQAMQEYAATNGGIDGLQVFSHSGQASLLFNQSPNGMNSLYTSNYASMFESSLGEHAADISQISPSWFNENADIKLWGCNAGAGPMSFAQDLSTQINQNVNAATGPTVFSGYSDGLPGQGLPPDPTKISGNYSGDIYLVPQYTDSGFESFAPSGGTQIPVALPPLPSY